MEILGLFFMLAFIISYFRDKRRAKSNGSEKKKKASPPATYSLQKAGIMAKDKEYYYWERRERKEAWRRKFWKEKEKELKRKGYTGYTTPYSKRK